MTRSVARARMPISTLILSVWGSLKRYRLIGSIEVQGSANRISAPRWGAIEVPLRNGRKGYEKVKIEGITR